MNKICIAYTHGKLGDLVWQLPYIKAISDFHNQKITLVVRPTTHAKILYKDLNYIDEIIYNTFKKKIYYLIEIIKLLIIFKKKNFSHIYLLDKVNRTAIAARLSRIKNIIGVGIGNQKKWLTNKSFLKEEDQKLTYSEQSQKFCRINNIKVDSFYPQISIKKERLDLLNMYPYKSKYSKVSFCVDSSEEYKIWPEEYFFTLAKMLYEKNLGDLFFLISHPKNKTYVDKIFSFADKSFKNYFVDCSNMNLLEICKVILDSKFMVGNNTGPTNLAAALNVRSYNLISSSSLREMKFSKVIPILPDNYLDPINTTVKKVGDSFVKSREEMRKITPQKVFAKISETL
jgi:heptosyltransferase-2